MQLNQYNKYIPKEEMKYFRKHWHSDPKFSSIQYKATVWQKFIFIYVKYKSNSKNTLKYLQKTHRVHVK